MAPQPNHKILEIGCGVGIAVEMIASRLTDGYIVAIDKSKAMIEKAKKRNQLFTKASKTKFYQRALKVFSSDHTFDKIFCFNVNLFWTKKSITSEAEILKAHLSKNGHLYIFFGPLFPRGYQKIIDPVKVNLAREKFVILDTLYNKTNDCCCFVVVK